jgi:thiaminase/transcriptional activator TenA
VTLTSDLKAKYCSLWESMTHHRFVSQLGDDSLPSDAFKTYFLQDYVFVNDLVVLVAQAIAKAPNLNAASIFNDFLTGVLDPENDLFMRFFDQLGASEKDYSSVKASPTTQAFGDFLVRTSFEGTFDEIVMVLYVTEGTYLDWGARLMEEKVKPANSVYKEWIDLHGPEVLGDLVSWLENYINNDSKITAERADYLFHTALRYEFLFWESACNDELWFDV